MALFSPTSRRWLARATLALSVSCGFLLTASLWGHVPIFSLGDSWVYMDRGKTILCHYQFHEMFAPERQQKVRWSHDSTSVVHDVRVTSFGEHTDRYGRHYPAFVSLALETSLLAGFSLVLIGLFIGIKYGR